SSCLICVLQNLFQLHVVKIGVDYKIQGLRVLLSYSSASSSTSSIGTNYPF
ncbi:hypothetical protein L9F63_008004, partial [Diploptera punctata]